jgi:hypothetical protein
MTALAVVPVEFVTISTRGGNSIVEIAAQPMAQSR